jgi:TetR/AcrR family transcriptional regulator, transcriptional repressor for nem operon
MSTPIYRQVDMSKTVNKIDTKEKIMNAARLTLQDCGYAGLSFRELAKEVGIKSASIHYYFPTKGELGAAVLQRYTSNLAEYLDGLLTKGLDQDVCLKKYTDVFRTTLRNGNRMCLGGMLAAEHKELPAEVQAEVINFAEMNIRWLVRVLFLDKKVRLGVEAIQSRARAIYAAILGAQLAGRSRDDVSIYDEIVKIYRSAGLIP